MQRSFVLRSPYLDPMHYMQVDLLQRWRASGREDRALFEAHPSLGPPQAWQLARHSLDASFAPEPVKAGWRARLDEVFAEAAGQGAAQPKPA
jgi:hypothetical protein